MHNKGQHPGGNTKEIVTRLKEKADRYVDNGEVGGTTYAPIRRVEGNPNTETKRRAQSQPFQETKA